MPINLLYEVRECLFSLCVGKISYVNCLLLVPKDMDVKMKAVALGALFLIVKLCFAFLF